MAYELFDNKAAKFGSPQLTIRSGRIAFNADAGDILAKVGTRFAHIFWDADACKLAIRPVAKEDIHAFRVTIPKGKRGGSFSAQSFLNYIQWHADQPVVIAASWSDTERLLEARLPKENVGAGETKRGSRRKLKSGGSRHG
jgi:hypothetical protein